MWICLYLGQYFPRLNQYLHRPVLAGKGDHVFRFRVFAKIYQTCGCCLVVSLFWRISSRRFMLTWSPLTSKTVLTCTAQRFILMWRSHKLKYFYRILFRECILTKIEPNFTKFYLFSWSFKNMSKTLLTWNKKTWRQKHSWHSKTSLN